MEVLLAEKLVVSNAEVKGIAYFWAATIMSRTIDMNGSKLYPINS